MALTHPTGCATTHNVVALVLYDFTTDRDLEDYLPPLQQALTVGIDWRLPQQVVKSDEINLSRLTPQEHI